MSFEGLVGNTNYPLSEFQSNTAAQFSQHLENQANGLYDNNLIDPILIPNDPSVIADPTITTDTGETFTGIPNIGILNGDTSNNFVDGIDGSSHPDIYQFSIDISNDVAITLDNLSADADLYIIDSNGEIVGLSNNSDFVTETFSGNLEAGTYFVGVASYDGIATDYNLTVSSGDVALSSVEIDPGFAIAPEFSLI